MSILLNVLALFGLLTSAVFLPFVAQDNPGEQLCLYPSPSDRFGVTASKDIEQYDLTGFPASSFVDWRVHYYETIPNAMIYYPMIGFSRTRNGTYFYYPNGQELVDAIRRYPGATWIIGNEADTIWKNNLPPEVYAQFFHELYNLIRSIDPTAKFAATSLATVSTLRLLWLERAWNAYQEQYGSEMPVDVWNIHPYVVNEMHNEWGAEIPAGIDNAVGYAYGTWNEAADPDASGGTVHESNEAGARAYFAFHGSYVTLYLHTGPDAGMAEISIDRDLPTGFVDGPVDLYSPTPGILVRSYSNLPSPADPSDPRGDRHNIRIDVTGDRNPISGGAWVRVDAIEAASTADLPNGRLEDNSPLRANIVTSADVHDDLDLIEQNIRAFRQWMADHGQRNKPLIDTEHGILMTEDLGFDYPRVRAFMLNSFDRFLNGLRDPNLGYPADDNRLLQQWFWFSLAQDSFEGRPVHTGLFSQATGQLKPLGQDFIDYVTPLIEPYAEFQVTELNLTPTWALFAGEPSLIAVDTTVRNWGNVPAGPFQVHLAADGEAIYHWQVPGLGQRVQISDTTQLHYDWQTTVTDDLLLVVTADDSTGDLTDPCQFNNSQMATLPAQPYTDLAITDLTTEPHLLPRLQPGETMTVSLKANLVNLGSFGTADDQIVVNFWQGDPDHNGTLLHSQTLLPGSISLPVEVGYQWPDREAGAYDVVVEVEAASEETNLANNRQQLRVMVPAGVVFLPVVQHTAQVTPDLARPTTATTVAYWLPRQPQ